MLVASKERWVKSNEPVVGETEKGSATCDAQATRRAWTDLTTSPGLRQITQHHFFIPACVLHSCHDTMQQYKLE
jgi:hypothetical protein